jgi:DNA-3-methyladenine glycosylase
MHYALNIVTGKEGEGEGVLIRAGQPLEGIEQMKANRGKEDIKDLAGGPGKLTQALGIFDTSLSGKILNKSSILLEKGEDVAAEDIIASPRIGITKAAGLPWRFYIKDSPFVSKSKS